MSRTKLAEADYTAYGTKQERCVSLAKYIIDNKATVRNAGNIFVSFSGSKS